MTCNINWIHVIEGSWHVKLMSVLELEKHDIDMRCGPTLVG